MRTPYLDALRRVLVIYEFTPGPKSAKSPFTGSCAVYQVLSPESTGKFFLTIHLIHLSNILILLFALVGVRGLHPALRIAFIGVWLSLSSVCQSPANKHSL